MQEGEFRFHENLQLISTPSLPCWKIGTSCWLGCIKVNSRQRMLFLRIQLGWPRPEVPCTPRTDVFQHRKWIRVRLGFSWRAEGPIAYCINMAHFFSRMHSGLVYFPLLFTADMNDDLHLSNEVYIQPWNLLPAVQASNETYENNEPEFINIQQYEDTWHEAHDRAKWWRCKCIIIYQKCFLT